MTPRRLLATLAALALLVPGCGIDPQDAPRDLAVEAVPPATSGAPASTAGPELELWFLRDDRLVPVARSGADRDPGTALALLAEGPTADEAANGLTTAIGRRPLVVGGSGEGAAADGQGDGDGSGGDGDGSGDGDGDSDNGDVDGADRDGRVVERDGVLVVEVADAFSGLAGADQLAAVAQVVWTATAAGDVDAVAFTQDGQVLEVPTDDGLSDRPVDRSDYASLAPGSASAAPAPAVPTSSPRRTGRRPARGHPRARWVPRTADPPRAGPGT